MNNQFSTKAFGFIILLLVVAIIAVLTLIAFNTYFTKTSLNSTPGIGQIDEPLIQQNLSSPGYSNIIQNTRSAVQGLNQQLKERENQLYNSK